MESTPRQGQPTVKVAENGDSGGGAEKRRLEGTLTIFSQNGEEIGTAELNGSEQGG